MKLSILILTIPSRYAQFGRLQSELRSQILKYAGEIEIVVIAGEGTIGQKRNKALKRAQGDYVCFIDDDDIIAPNYIDHLMKAIYSGCDCASLTGEITFNGADAALFQHSIKYVEYKTVPDAVIKYERFPNHLNLIKSVIAKQFKFPEINHGEDTDWATQIRDSGLLKSEYYIPDIIYYYRYITNKQHELQPK